MENDESEEVIGTPDAPPRWLPRPFRRKKDYNYSMGFLAEELGKLVC
jgi:hypothetical protein